MHCQYTQLKKDRSSSFPSFFLEHFHHLSAQYEQPQTQNTVGALVIKWRDSKRNGQRKREKIGCCVWEGLENMEDSEGGMMAASRADGQ